FTATAMNNHGDALVAWRENGEVFASRSSSSSRAWSPEALVFADGLVNGENVGLEEGGAAAVSIWRDQMGPEIGQYDPSTGAWTAKMLSAPQPSIWPGILAIPNTQRQLGLWQENPNLGGDPLAIWIAWYEASSSSWSAKQRLDLAGATYFDGARIHATPNGH